MQDLERNNVNLFGEQGKRWIQSLPQISKALAEKWQLVNITPVENMSWNYVAKAVSVPHGPVVLKISIDPELISNEIMALDHFRGTGMVSKIDHDKTYHAMLLHQAIPGESLRQRYLYNVEETIQNYTQVVSRLIEVKTQNFTQFKHVRDWLKVFNRIDKGQLPVGLHDQAVKVSRELLSLGVQEFVLHGDLHQENIISKGNDWLAIDPKGIVGPVAFEAACFDFIHQKEIETKVDIPLLFLKRSQLLADQLQIHPQELQEWVFVRLVLGACWMIEDNGNRDVFLKQINAIFPERSVI